VLSGLAEARMQQYELAMFTAWRTAAFLRGGKLPSRVPNIRKPAPTASPERPQSGVEVLSIMRQLMAMTNGPASAEGTDGAEPQQDTE
jgi:hypothetical protein